MDNLAFRIWPVGDHIACFLRHVCLCVCVCVCVLVSWKLGLCFDLGGAWRLWIQVEVACGFKLGGGERV